MPNLFPVFDVQAVFGQQPQAAAPHYGKGLFFDFATGDIVVDGAGRLAVVDGHTAWAQWCVKAVLTERFAFLVYGSGYGAELQGIAREASRPLVQARIERAITEALMADPRTESVREFATVWTDAGAQVSFTVTPVIGTPQRLEVKLSG